MSTIAFDPIQLTFQQKLIEHVQTSSRDIPSMLNMISKFDHNFISQKFSINNNTLRIRKWMEDKCGGKSVISKAYESKTQYMALQRHASDITKKVNIAHRLHEDLKSRSRDLESQIKSMANELEAFFRKQPSRIKEEDTNHLFPLESCIPFNQEVNDVWFVDRVQYDRYYDPDIHEKPRVPTLPVANWRGPFKSLLEVLGKCKNGDKIYVHGEQSLDVRIIERIEVDIQIIGVNGVE
eukprot:235714_1